MKKTKLSSYSFITATLSLVALMATTSVYGQSRRSGPGVGGGTNTLNGELVEFKKPYKEIPINPRTYRNILNGLNAKLNRLEYILPGVRETLEQAFEKQWVITDEVFPPRVASEKMPIFQNEHSVKITYNWVKNASPEKLAQAWLHEMVRSFAQNKMSLSLFKILSIQNNSIVDLQKREDLITETLTVLIYEEKSYDETKKVWTETLREALGTNHVVAGGRDLMYKTITDGRLDKRFDDLCHPYFLRNEVSTSREIENRFTGMGSSTNKNKYYGDHFLKSNLDRSKVDPDFNIIRSDLIESYVTQATRWQALLNDKNFSNAYKSIPMEAVAEFAKLTTSVIEGVEINIDINNNKYIYYSMRNYERVKAIHHACETYKDILPKIFAEYRADNGIAKNVPPTVEATSQSDVDNFFKK